MGRAPLNRCETLQGCVQRNTRGLAFSVRAVCRDRRPLRGAAAGAACRGSAGAGAGQAASGNRDRGGIPACGEDAAAWADPAGVCRGRAVPDGGAGTRAGAACRGRAGAGVEQAASGSRDRDAGPAGAEAQAAGSNPAPACQGAARRDEALRGTDQAREERGGGEAERPARARERRTAAPRPAEDSGMFVSGFFSRFLP